MGISKSDPRGSRATRLRLDSIPVGTVSTHWNLVSATDGSFTVVTTAKKSSSGNVLDSSTSFIDIWLPPVHTYTVRTRHGLDSGSVTAWTKRKTIESRGLLNSFDKFHVLSDGKADNV